jgi:murein DD-endopeptidase MepM/ murein hydrolase activator NlpD
MDDPLSDLLLGPLFKVPYAQTRGGKFGDPRESYPGDHEGADYDVIGTDPDSKEPVLAPCTGLVESSRRTEKGYGERVRIKGIHNREIFWVWVAHLDDRYVEEGDWVEQGEPVGEIGATGNASGEHAHITLQHRGTGESGYVLPYVRDPHPLMIMNPNVGRPQHKSGRIGL